MSAQQIEEFFQAVAVVELFPGEPIEVFDGLTVIEYHEASVQ